MNNLINNKNKKGDAMQIARIAAIQATKMTSNLIPLCHNIPLSSVNVDIELLKVSYCNYLV